MPPAGANMEAIERSLVVQTLERTGWNRGRHGWCSASTAIGSAIESEEFDPTR